MAENNFPIEAQLYVEKRIETRRVFLRTETATVVVKSIPRTLVRELWGEVDSFKMSTGTRQREQLLPSAKAANDYKQKLCALLLSEGFQRYTGPDDPTLAEESKLLFDHALTKAKQILAESPETCSAPPLDALEWDILEDEFKITFPASYRTFISHFNGCHIHLYEGVLYDTRFYSLEEARYSHQRLVERDYGEAYLQLKCFPIGETSNREIAVIRTSTSSREETPVLDAVHDGKPSQWIILFPSFADFFTCYVEHHKDSSPIHTPKASFWAPPLVDPSYDYRR